MTLIESIYQEPESWTPSEHWFIHKDGARLWIANGMGFCKPHGGNYSFLNRWRAWKAYRWWCVNAPVSSFGTTD